MLSVKQRQLVLDFKEHLKKLAESIKTARPEFRKSQSVYDKSGHQKDGYTFKDQKLGEIVWKNHMDLTKMRHEFRHQHIARCLLRGRTMDQIECCGSAIAPDMKYVELIMKQFKEQFDAGA